MKTTAHFRVNEESSDDNQQEEWGADESDWRTSSSSDPRLSTASRFSLLAFPSKVRDSVFRKPQQKTKDRSSTADTTRTSSAASTPRESALATKKRQECENVEKFRVFWDEKLRGTMERLAGSKLKSEEAQEDLFHLLLQLYAHQDVVEQLYSSYERSAEEFEFYIPQLCTFLLHGNYAKQHQLECFLLSRSGESLPFAHRLTWFLRSFCDDAKEYQSEFLSVTGTQNQENADLLTAIGRRAGVPALLMSTGLCMEEVCATKPVNLQRRRSSMFPTDELDLETMETDESFAGHLLCKRTSLQDEARMDEGNLHQIALFRQTPTFVEALTDLAEKLIPTPRPQRNSELRKGLSEIRDEMLPSDVIYLPIGNSQHRVKGIQVEECFTFSTKERVPYFLCVEVLDYSVASPTAAAKKQRKRRRTKANRNQSRVFSLKLPFSKSEMDLEEAVDGSPMSSCTSAESELNFVPSPSVASPLPEIEEEKDPIAMGPLISLQDAEVAVTADLLDGEDGDDEMDIGERKARKSFLEDEDLQRAAEKQQERMGQWNLPRPRRRSIKEYSSSASARSGGQFDSFYSSWFSKKIKFDDDDEVDSEFTDLTGDTVQDSTAVEKDEVAGDASKDTEPSGVDLRSETANAHGISSTKPIECIVPPTETAVANDGILSSLFIRKPKDGVDAQFGHKHEVAATVCGTVETEIQNDVALKESGAPTTPAQAPGLFSSLFAKKSTSDIIKPLIQDEVKKADTTTCSSSSEERDVAVDSQSTATPADPVGLFASLFTKKPQGITEVTVVVAEGAGASVSSLDTSEVGSSDNVSAEDADGEDSESRGALPSDNDPADATDSSSIGLSEGLTNDLDAEDADGEDTDSNGEFFSDRESIAYDPEPSPVQTLAEKPASFASWFSRKPATELPVTEEGEVPAQLAVGEVGTTYEGRDLSVSAQDNMTLERSLVVNEGSSQDESLPKGRRQRDLSVSLDFADPTAWKEKFDLEDDLSDDEPDAENPDIDTVEEDVEEDLELSDEDDEKPMIVFRERWSEKEARIRRESPFGDHPGWRLLSVIVKSNDDLRQEQFAAQLIAQCDRIFREYSLPLSLRPYNVIATSAKTGLIEAVPDTVSLDSLKRNDPGYTTLIDFYTRLHGDKETTGFARAQRNFAESLAAYSIVCYVFQIKDRHNGNILVDTDGHVIHIDFGFLLTNSPGSNWNFERAPFKLTDEFVELMGGPRSSTFRYFRSLCIRAYLALRRNMDQIVLLVEMMLIGNSDLPCFAGGKKAVIEGLRARLKPGARTSTCQVFVNQLIDQSINNWRTRWYDKYQRACLGIL